MTDLSNFRVYEPDECGTDGYPLAWHRTIKHLVREHAGHRCVRCRHPYPPGIRERCPKGEWTPCEIRCAHDGPLRVVYAYTVKDVPLLSSGFAAGDLVQLEKPIGRVEARYRILTVHHLRLGADAKRDLRWWNLAALCQRCHLQIQGKVVMERIWPWPHSDWFRPYAAGWYAWTYLGENLTREQVEARMDELLALELAA